MLRYVDRAGAARLYDTAEQLDRGTAYVKTETGRTRRRSRLVGELLTTG
jgi:hypothetical protein